MPDTDDGVDGSVYDSSSSDNGALDETHDQIVGRLAFLNSLSKWRRIVSIAWMLCPEASQRPPEFEDTLRSWLRHAQKVRRELEDLVMEVWRHRLQRPTQDYLSLAEFDRSRMIKESLMEHIVVTCVETAQCAHFIICALHEDTLAESDELDLCADERLAIRQIRLSLQGRRQ